MKQRNTYFNTLKSWSIFFLNEINIQKKNIYPKISEMQNVTIFFKKCENIKMYKIIYYKWLFVVKHLILQYYLAYSCNRDLSKQGLNKSFILTNLKISNYLLMLMV